jgi:hypothetical protein
MTRWSLGTLVGLPAAILGTAALIVGAYFAWRWAKRTRGDKYGEHGVALTFLVLAVAGVVAAVAGIAWGMWPYKAEYHQWRTETGTVTAVDSRFVGQDRSTTQRFVVTLDGVRQRSCDDTRCAQVKPGDALTLSCKRAWQYAGTHGYDCNFVARRAAA